MTFFSDDMGLVTIDLNNINHLDDDNLDEDDPETIVVIWLIAWWNRYMQRKIDGELMPIARHSVRVRMVYEKRWKAVEW